MKRQQLTPDQYRRANQVLMLTLSVVHAIFIVIEMNGVYDGTLSIANYIRIAIYLLGIIAINVLTKVILEGTNLFTINKNVIVPNLNHLLIKGLL